MSLLLFRTPRTNPLRPVKTIPVSVDRAIHLLASGPNAYQATTALACLGTLVMRVNELLAAVTTCRVGMGAPVVNLLSGRLASALQAGQEPIVPTTYALFLMEHA